MRDRSLQAAAAVLVLSAIVSFAWRLEPAMILQVLTALIGIAIVVPWAISAMADEAPREQFSGTTTTLILVGLVLILMALTDVADLLGAEGGPLSQLIIWLVFGAIAAVPGWRMNSPSAALVSSLAFGIAFMALYDLLFDLNSPPKTRVLLLIVAAALGVVAAVLLPRRYRHAVAHVTGAGLVMLVFVSISFAIFFQISITSRFLGDDDGIDSFEIPFQWELLGLLGTGAVLAFGAARRESGPGVFGALGLTGAVLVASFPSMERSIIGWPLVLIVLALAAVAAVFATGQATLPSLPGRGPTGSPPPRPPAPPAPPVSSAPPPRSPAPPPSGPSAPPPPPPPPAPPAA